MRFNISWDSSVDSAPADFKTDVLAVAQFYATAFTDPVTVNIAVGFGEVGGQTLPTGALGASLTYMASLSYRTLTSALKLDATTADDASAAHSLPAFDPTGGRGHYFVSTADAKALSLYAGTGLDGYVGFSATAPFTYDASNGVATGSYDFFGVVAHEFSEIMGRQLLAGQTLGTTTHSYTALDLFHYASAGVRALTGTTAGYFSINGGVTHLQSFNTNPAGDFGDWSSSAGADAFDAFSYSGVVNKITAGDLTALDVIGWNRGSTSSTTASFPSSTTVHLAATHAGAAHDGGAQEAALALGHGLQTSTLFSDFSAYYGA